MYITSRKKLLPFRCKQIFGLGSWLILSLALGLAFLCFTQSNSFAQGITFAGQEKRDLPVNFETKVFRVDNESSANIVLLWLTPASGYYAYANDPGEGGRPTTVNLTFDPPDSAAAKGFEIIYPLGIQVSDVYSDGKQVNAYYGKTGIYIYLPRKHVEDGQVAEGAIEDVEVQLAVSMLICSTQNCIPVKKNLSVHLAASDYNNLPRAESQSWWRDFKSAQVILHDSTPAMVPVYDAPGFEIESLGKALILGFLAGFILNFMPCVFPVVSLKLLSFFITLGQSDVAARISAFRRQNAMFALGVIVWFTVLSAILSALDMLWGQIFQSQGMVIAMLLLVFALTLSLFGLFMLPSFSFRESHGRLTKRSAFLTGILATCLATPCSGPLLGGVLGWSFNQPQPILGIVFVSVGLGMASPYILLAIFPRLGRHFPVPGPWLAKLEVLLGFFLLLTCAYLFSLLTGEARVGAASAMGALFVLGWVWGKIQKKRGMGGIFHWRWILGCAAALGLFLAVWNFMWLEDRKITWVPYTQEEFLALQGKKNIVLDFTADWCPNCKILERTVFTAERMEDWQERWDAVFMQVDLTSDNQDGYNFLAALNSSSIPVVALFPKVSTESGELTPVVLRDIFGSDRLEEAADKAWGAPKH